MHTKLRAILPYGLLNKQTKKVSALFGCGNFFLIGERGEMQSQNCISLPKSVSI